MQYSQIRGQTLATKTFSSLEKIFNIISQEEQHKKLIVGHDDRSETATAYAVDHNSKPQGSNDRGTCKHYRKFGHDEISCYELVGYPPGWDVHGKSYNRGRGPRCGPWSRNRV